MLDRQRINSIDVFRFVCALLVVAIHTRPFEYQNEVLGFVFVQVLPRIAVPFFFCVSGYFYINNLESGNKCVFTTFIKVLKTYLVWSAIYLVVDIIEKLLRHAFSPIPYLKDCILRLFFYGSYYHFWYFIALLLSILIVGLFYKLRAQKVLIVLSGILYILGLLGESYYALGNQVLVLNNFINSSIFIDIRRIFLMGLPFFVSGYFVNKLQNRTREKSLTIAMVIAILLFVFEIILIQVFSLGKSIVITVFLYPIVIIVMLLLMKHPLSSCSSRAAKCRSLANYTFYIHPLFILFLTSVFENFGFQIWNIGMYCLTVVLCYISWLIIRRLNKPFLNKYIIG